MTIRERAISVEQDLLYPGMSEEDHSDNRANIESAIRAAGEPLAAALRVLLVEAVELEMLVESDRGRGEPTDPPAFVAARAALAEWEK